MKDSSSSGLDQVPQIEKSWAITLVFMVNFFLLVLELIAGRLMAPLVGVNLYTWTSIIGVILTGISIGNYVGGIIADRWGSRSILSSLLILSGFGTASILLTIKLIPSLLDLDVPFIIEILLLFSTVFLFPSTILGTITPVVIKLVLDDLNTSGNVIGKIYAAAALGSIAGTFTTGFLLISVLGVRLIIWCVASGLVLTGAIVGLYAHHDKFKKIVLVLYILFLLSFFFVQKNNWLASSCLKETNYYCINVLADIEKPNVRLLVLDKLIHSYVNLDNPTDLGYGYEYIYANVLGKLFKNNPNFSVLFIGGGGYTLPRYIENVYPNSRISVIEIDSGVTEIAIKELGLNSNKNIITYNQDARRFINSSSASQRYDLILNDAANDVSIPYHLTTVEFDRLITKNLASKGVYISNIIDGKSGKLLHAYLNTVKQVFDYVYLSPVGQKMGESIRNTFVVVSANRPLNLSTPLFLSNKVLEGYLQEQLPIILTDDYAPVDNLLAPMFVDASGR